MRVAALTMMHNEPVWARVWARHYAREVGAANCLILDHGSTDGSLEGLGLAVERVRRTSLDEDARAALISDCAAALLRQFDVEVHSDADELLIADPTRFADLQAYAAEAPSVATAVGLDLQHLPEEERPLDLSHGIGGQRRWSRFSGAMCKPAMIGEPVRWVPGFHGCDRRRVWTPLYLLHLRYADLDAGLSRLARTRAQAFARVDVNMHQRVSDDEFREMVLAIGRLPREEAPILGEDGLAAGWLAEMDRLGVGGGMALSGDRLWALPEAVLKRV